MVMPSARSTRLVLHFLFTALAWTKHHTTHKGSVTETSQSIPAEAALTTPPNSVQTSELNSESSVGALLFGGSSSAVLGVESASVKSSSSFGYEPSLRVGSHQTSKATDASKSSHSSKSKHTHNKEKHTSKSLRTSIRKNGGAASSGSLRAMDSQRQTISSSGPMPSQSELRILFDIANMRTLPAVRKVDSSCSLRIERIKPARFCVQTATLGALVGSPVCVDEQQGLLAVINGPLGSQYLHEALLCSVVQASAGRDDKGKSAVPLASTPVLTMVTSADYLLDNWLSFVNKASYCERTHRRLYLWMGTAGPAEELAARPQLLPENIVWAPRCTAAEPTNNTVNIYKTVAILALLDASPRPDAVMYMDADTWFADGAGGAKAATPEMYMSVAPHADLVRCSGNCNLYVHPGCSILRSFCLRRCK
eukprot:2440112-Pleurochrysis_carterae.AAC.2